MNHEHEDERDRELEARIAALPRDIAPGPAVWQGIEARIKKARPRPSWLPRVLTSRRAQVTAGGLALAAAAALALLVSRPRTPVHGPIPQPIAVVSPAPMEPAALAPLPEEEPYLSVLASLNADFVRSKGALAATEAQLLEDNLRILDGAIAATRTALSGQPESLELKSQLADTYQQKIHLEADVIDLGARI